MERGGRPPVGAEGHPPSFVPLDGGTGGGWRCRLRLRCPCRHDVVGWRPIRRGVEIWARYFSTGEEAERVALRVGLAPPSARGGGTGEMMKKKKN